MAWTGRQINQDTLFGECSKSNPNWVDLLHDFEEFRANNPNNRWPCPCEFKNTYPKYKLMNGGSFAIADENLFDWKSKLQFFFI